MKRRDPWFIWGQDGESATCLKQSSVRLGRALRAARAIGRYTQSTVFIAKAKDKAELASTKERHYA